jgi:uncharacterized membrane protein YgcG
MNRRIANWIAIIVVILLSLAHGAEDWSERILYYHSDIEVFTSGRMQVTETIRVVANRDQINHGIFRTFPTRYRDRNGNRYIVPITVKQTERNGQSENFHIEEITNGVKIYLGSGDVLLDPGVYTYILSYETERQLGFFRDFDELYWNVTGNDWAFAIDTVSASVTLPADAANRLIGWTGYTGPAGSRAKDLSFQRLPDGRFFFQASRPLSSNEGMTIVLNWPVGMIVRPDSKTKALYVLKDNAGLAIGLLGCLVILMYYYLQWLKVGRDPLKGTIIPQFQPPDNLSPASVRYLKQMSFDDKCFTAFLISMAVRSAIKICEEDGTYSLEKTKSNTDISLDERAVLSALFNSTNKLVLKNSNHTVMQAAIALLKKQLVEKYHGSYFRANRFYFWPGVALSFIIIIAASFSYSTAAVAFLLLWLSLWSVGVGLLVYRVFRAWKTVLDARSFKYAAVGSALFLSLFSLPFVGGELAGLYSFALVTSQWMIGLFVVLVFINYLFHHLLKAYTQHGRSVMDSVEGFVMYLTAAEKERWNTLLPADKTPELFEKYLPYALALDVEQEWSEQFASIITDARQMQQTMGWYSGSHGFSGGFSDFTSSFSSSFSSSVSSSSVAPGSSSGSGGGGSSGGGGGGGGGGGW